MKNAIRLLQIIVDSTGHQGRCANADLLADQIRRDMIDADRFRFCMQWGYPQLAGKWVENVLKWEFWLPGGEMAFHIARGDTKEAAIDAAMSAMAAIDAAKLTKE